MAAAIALRGGRYYFKKYGTWDEVAKLYRLFRLYWRDPKKPQYEIYPSVSLALTPRVFRYWSDTCETGLVLLGVRYLYHKMPGGGRPA